MKISAQRPAGDPVPFFRAVIRSIRHPAAAGQAHLAAFDSGTSALTAAVRAAIIARPAVHEPVVLVPAYCCPDVVTAVLSAGAHPQLVDVEKNSLFTTPAQILSAVSDRTIALIDVFSFGASPDRHADLFKKLRDRGILTIADRAQCRPEIVPPDGYDIAIHSFGRGKPATLGSGGLLCFGMAVYSHVLSAYSEALPARSPLAAVINTLLRYVTFRIAIIPVVFARLTRIKALGISSTHRKANRRPRKADMVLSNLMANQAALPAQGISRAQRTYSSTRWNTQCSPLTRQEVTDQGVPLWRFPILAASRALRDELHDTLNREGLGATKMYGAAVVDFFRDGNISAGIDATPLPNAQDLAERLLTLPTHSGISDRLAKRIVSIASRVPHRI